MLTRNAQALGPENITNAQHRQSRGSRYQRWIKIRNFNSNNRPHICLKQGQKLQFRNTAVSENRQFSTILESSVNSSKCANSQRTFL